jgi:hypothetical protein
LKKTWISFFFKVGLTPTGDNWFKTVKWKLENNFNDFIFHDFILNIRMKIKRYTNWREKILYIIKAIDSKEEDFFKVHLEQ